MPHKPEDFTPTQVAALLENLTSEFRTVTEGVQTLSEDVRSLKEDMAEVKRDLTVIKDAVRIAIPSLTKRIEKIEVKI